MALADLAGNLDYPMIIVTATSRSGERSGCLVGFHTQCSIHPPRWAVYLSIENHTYAIALDSEMSTICADAEFPRARRAVRSRNR